MKYVGCAMVAVLLAGQTLVPVAAAAVSEQDGILTAPFRIEPATTFAGDAAQGSTVPKQPSPGGRLLRNALIGAAIGGALFAWVGSAGDCGRCGADRAKAILAGAMYGALVGAAIRIHPARRPSPSHRSRQVTIGPQLTKTAKGVNVFVSF